MDPFVKQILNALRCPLCGSQVDMIDWKMKTSTRKYNFCCATDWEHYRIYFIHWDTPACIDEETVILYEGRHQYEIRQGNCYTYIFIRDIDAENRVIENQKAKLVTAADFSYDKRLFDFSHTNREKIVNRVKTILVFQ